MESEAPWQTSAVTAEISRLEAYARDWDASHAGDGLRQLCRESARYLWCLAFARSPRSALEVGCGSGYSTLWMASALSGTDGMLTAVDIDPYRIEMAQSSIGRARLTEHVEFHLGELTERVLVERFPHGIDFVFIDCWKPAYAPTLRMVLPFLNAEAVVVADNVVSHRDRLGAFLGVVSELTALGVTDVATLPCGEGLLVMRYRRHRAGKRDERACG